MLDERGIISQKYFEQSYRIRPTARIFEEWALGASEHAPPADAQRVISADIGLRAWTDSPRYRPYQQVRLHVELSLQRDTHVFASPVPDGYTPFSLQVDPLDGLQVDEYALPAPHPFTVEGLDERFLVYEGSVRTMIPLRLTKNLGPITLTLRANYQSCAPTVCFPPATLRVDVPLNGLDLIRD